jgi:hypothetical protein
MKMKKLLFTLVLGLLSFVNCPTSLNAQTIPPPFINYQAVLYDVNGANPNNPLTNQSFSTFVNINDELGNLLYREEHYASTDANGLITVKMGDGLYTAGPITNFNQINWGVGKYYLVVDFDINGTISSTAPEQLVTVPYSFYAGKAGNGMTAVADNGNGTLTFTYANGATYTTPTLSGIQGPAGPAGPSGPSGASGTAGAAGQSAYDLWLGQGNTGTVQDFLSTSAYQIWLAQGNTGTAQDFLNTLVGPSGPQGIQGIPGTNGTNGSTGPQGPQGIQGVAGVNGVNGTDGRSAYEIAVLNGFVGTETQWLLSLVGATGPAGATGVQGPQGIQGPAGNDGVTGAQGPIGLTGATGPQGVQGPAGNDGATGSQGPIGLTGPQGIQGPVGNDGATGPQGPAGNDGATGPQGPIGLTGATGPQGPAGANGLNGQDGAQGPIGLTGATGLQGLTGLTGPIGEQGPQGIQGIAGTNGTNGSFPSGTVAGEMIYWNGIAWVTVPPGPSLPGNQALTLSLCYGVPTWGPCPAALPTVTTTEVSAITANSATSGGAVTSAGGAAISAWGICWSTSPNPTITNSFSQNNVSFLGFTSALSGLSQNTTYYVRAYASNSAGTGYGNQQNFTTAPILTIGQSYQGGVIAYVDASGIHGLIAAPNDQSSGAQWGCYGTSISGADGTAYGTGNQNTIDIMNGCSTAGIAARLCGDLVLGGYSDWYLPSLNELNLLFVNKDAIGGFALGYYYSSTEYGTGGTAAWDQYFVNGGQTFTSKNAWDRVRAVRTF